MKESINGVERRRKLGRSRGEDELLTSGGIKEEAVQEREREV